MKKILAIVAAFAVVGFNGFMLMEGGVMNAQEVSDFDVTLTVTSELALNCNYTSSSLPLTPSIPGMTGGSAVGTTDCNVETSNDLGWTVTIKDNGSDGGQMVDGTNVIDYYPTTTPGAWVLDSTSAAYYGYYASSTNATTSYGYNLYRNLTNAEVAVASNGEETSSLGVDITFGFKAEVGSTANQPSGSYVSSVLVTATEN